jgi:hypothetical protein
MFETSAASEKPDYALLVKQIRSILEGERNLSTNASQFSAFIYHSLTGLNWAGFYLCAPAKNPRQNFHMIYWSGRFRAKSPARAFRLNVASAVLQQRKNAQCWLPMYTRFPDISRVILHRILKS